jgi:hypothetical protein
MRGQGSGLLRLLAALLPLAAARAASGQPCTIQCWPDFSVTAEGELTMVPLRLPALAGCSPGRYLTQCNDPANSEYPVGTTTVSCTITVEGSDQVLVCEYDVTVVPPTDPGVTFTESPVPHPIPTESVYEGASFGRIDVFYTSSQQFYVYEDGAFRYGIPSQGFVAFNAAPTDTGVSFIGHDASDRLATADVEFCDEGAYAFAIKLFDQFSPDTSQGIFWNGNGTGLVCGGTPADGTVFFQRPGGLLDHYPLPAGAHLQELFPDGNACVALTTGTNGIFRYDSDGTAFTNLPFTPGSGTPAPSGNLYVTDAFDPWLYEMTRSAQQLAQYGLPQPLFRVHTLPNGDLFGFAGGRTFVIFDPDFGQSATHVLSGTGSTIIDLKPSPGTETLVFLRDAAAGRSFVRNLDEDLQRLIDDLPRYLTECLRKDLRADGRFPGAP